jgi:hypothetical protein
MTSAQQHRERITIGIAVMFAIAAAAGIVFVS